MNNAICIIGDLEPYGDQVNLHLAEAGYSVLNWQQGQAADPGQYQNVVLLITCQAAQPPDLDGLLFSDHVPMLVVGDTASPPSWLATSTPSRLIDYQDITAPPEALAHRLHVLAQVNQIAIERSSYLAHHQNFLDWFSNRDGLTGLYNRHHFNQKLAELFTLSQRDDSELTLLLLDIDNFSEINKDFGQSFGDFVLNELAARLTSEVCNTGLCFRLSGGEFAILLPQTDFVFSRNLGKNLLAGCENKLFCRNSIERRVTLSIGLASYCINEPGSYDEMVNMAQTALFKAKAEGRNRLYTFAPAETSDLSPDGSNFETVKMAISRLLEKTRTSTISSLQLLARDIATTPHLQHLEQVTTYIELLGTRLGLSGPIIRTLQNAAILHSSIRQLIHNDLLSKTEMFSNQDQDTLRDFPYKLSEIIDIFDYFSQERLVLLTQAERFDGSGYPEGLKGDEIPLGARIIGIIDAFVAMATERPYRSPLSPDLILEELQSEAGKQFDPFLVNILLDIIDEQQLLDVSSNTVVELKGELSTLLPKKPS